MLALPVFSALSLWNRTDLFVRAPPRNAFRLRFYLSDSEQVIKVRPWSHPTNFTHRQRHRTTVLDCCWFDGFVDKLNTARRNSSIAMHITQLSQFGWNVLDHLTFSLVPNRAATNRLLLAGESIGLGKKKCRICDRNLTLYLTNLELSVKYAPFCSQTCCHLEGNVIILLF